MNNFYAFEGSEHVFGVRTEKNELEIKAIKKIEDKIEKTKQEYIQGKIDFYPPGAFVAGYDIDNKYVWADYSRTITLKKDLHKQLRDLIDKKIGEGKINEYGEYGKKTPRGQIGRCAEVHVVDKILKFNENFYKNNNKIDNIRLSFAVRFKDKNKIHNRVKALRMKQESTGMDVANHFFRMLKDTETKLVPYCDNCVSMFEGTNILKKMFRIYW